MPATGRPRRESRPHENLARAVVRALSDARQDAGLSRRELAARSGVSENTIIKIERAATTDPAFTVVLRLAHALGMSMDGLTRRAQDLAQSPPEFVAVQPVGTGVVRDSSRTGGPESER